MKTAETPLATLSLYQDGLLHTFYKKDVVMTRELMGEHFKIAMKLCGKTPVKQLLCFSENFTTTPEASVIASQHKSFPNRLATAVYSPIISNHIIWENYIEEFKPETPTQVFQFEEEAKQWLQYFTSENSKKWVRTKAFEIHVRKPDFVHYKIREGATISKTEVEMSRPLTLKMTDGKKVKLLVDAQAHFSVSPEILGFSAGRMDEERTIAMAIVSTNKASVFMINGFLRLAPSKIPMKLFSTEEEAMQWLNQINS